MNYEEALGFVLKKHSEWLKGKPGGVKLELTGANLENAYLGNANLEGANFVEANLESANFVRASLYKANFFGADLKRVNLITADMRGAISLPISIIKETK